MIKLFMAMHSDVLINYQRRKVMKSKLLKIIGLVFALSVIFTICTVSADALTTGWQQDESGTWYYYEQNGEAATGWKQIKGVWYLFEYDGRMVSDCIYTIDGKSYKFDESGALLTGWISMKYHPLGETYWMYANQYGSLVKGWAKLNNKWYYFDEYFDMVRDVYEVDGVNYLFNHDGQLSYGWVRQKYVSYDGDLTDGDWFYSDSKGVAQNGWKVINGKWYYFDEEDFYMHNGPSHINGKFYYLTFDGALAYGWNRFTYTYDGSTRYGDWYYSGNDGVIRTGWQKLNNKWYYFDTDEEYSGGMIVGPKTIDGKLYVFDSNGALSYGWTYVILRDNENKIYEEGWFFTDNNGVAKTGWQQINGKWYYFDDSYGEMYVGTAKIEESDGTYKTYYFDGSGAWVKNPSGWVHCTTYLKGEGYVADYGWFLFKNGEPLTGWQLINGKWYYFNTYYGYMYTGACNVFDDDTNDSKMYFFDKNGAMVKSSGWFQDFYIDEVNKVTYTQWYYLNKGEALEGWKNINGKWYFFNLDRNGAMAQGVVTDSNTDKTYYFNEDGSMTTKSGWVRDFYCDYDDGKFVYDTDDWYYTNTDGTVKTGWLKIGSQQYYLDPKHGGRMVTGSMTMDGYIYYFNSNGALIAKQEQNV